MGQSPKEELMPIVKVEAPEQANTYDIHIGHELLKKAAGLLERCRGHRAMIVTDENVAPLYLDCLLYTSPSPRDA